MKHSCRMNRFEKKALFGKGIVITRPKEQAADFAGLLRAHGAKVIYFPTIKVVPTKQWRDLDKAIGNIESYQWIIFTSVNGVKIFFNRFKVLGRVTRDLKGIRICTIGPATAGVIEEQGMHVDLVPESFIAEGVVRAFRDREIKGRHILLPRAEMARDVIPEGLSELGAQVDVITVYRTVSSSAKKTKLEKLIKNGDVDVITFTSPSTVTNFMEIMGEGFTLPGGIRVACIGPVTAEAATKAGLKTDVMREPYTIPGLVAAIVDYFEKVGKNDDLAYAGKELHP